MRTPHIDIKKLFIILRENMTQSLEVLAALRAGESLFIYPISRSQPRNIFQALARTNAREKNIFSTTLLDNSEYTIVRTKFPITKFVGEYADVWNLDWSVPPPPSRPADFLIIDYRFGNCFFDASSDFDREGLKNYLRYTPSIDPSQTLLIAKIPTVATKYAEEISEAFLAHNFLALILDEANWYDIDGPDPSADELSPAAFAKVASANGLIVGRNAKVASNPNEEVFAFIAHEEENC